VFGLALKNCVRLDGSISWKRTRKEIRHLARYILAILVLVYLLVSLVYLSVSVVHTYIIPLDIVEDVFGQFRVDAVDWEEGIKYGSMGNIDQQYEDWSVAQGYSLEVPETLADILFDNWQLLLFILAIILIMLYFFQVKVLVGLTKYYVKRTLRRRIAYHRRDRVRAHSGSS
jgi:membrane-anchored glycerophosphoryl diester phosphodiesterase (GDPDase)